MCGNVYWSPRQIFERDIAHEGVAKCGKRMNFAFYHFKMLSIRSELGENIKKNHATCDIHHRFSSFPNRVLHMENFQSL